MEPLRSRKITTLHSNYTHEQAEQQLENKNKRRGLYRRLTLIALIALGISYCIGSMLHAQAEATQVKLNEKAKLEKQYASLKEQEKVRRAEIVKLNDDEYVAKLARNEYFLSEEGEIIFKLPNE
jgi:cell division protein DivIC